MDEAARRLGIGTDTVEVAAPADLERAFATLSSQRIGAVYVTMAGATYIHRGRVTELAVRHRLPTVEYFRELPEAGGVMSYGPHIFETYRRSAWCVGGILNGASPADLPIEQPSKFET